MNKSILVIDTPKSCRLCNLRTNCGQCEMCVAIEGYRIVTKYSEKGTKPVWCPLRPLPSYKDLTTGNDLESRLFYHFNQGYNTCLQEMEGE